MFAFSLALKLNSRSCLSSKRPPISYYIIDFITTCNSTRLCSYIIFFNMNRMALLSSAVISRANKCCREDKSSLQEKHSFIGRQFKRQTKHTLMNVVYFEKEVKKSVSTTIFVHDNYFTTTLYKYCL